MTLNRSAKRRLKKSCQNSQLSGYYNPRGPWVCRFFNELPIKLFLIETRSSINFDARQYPSIILYYNESSENLWWGLVTSGTCLIISILSQSEQTTLLHCFMLQKTRVAGRGSAWLSGKWNWKGSESKKERVSVRIGKVY